MGLKVLHRLAAVLRSLAENSSAGCLGDIINMREEMANGLKGDAATKGKGKKGIGKGKKGQGALA